MGSLLGSVGHRVKIHKISPATGNDRGDLEVKDYIVLQKPQAQDNRLPSKFRKAGELISAHREGRQKRRTCRLPHRNHLQIMLLRQIALLTKAGMEIMTQQYITHAVAQSMVLMEFSEEDMEDLKEYTPASRHLLHQAVGCRLHWRRIQLTDMTDRQERQSRWIVDQQAGRKFLEDHKGLGKFAGRVGKCGNRLTRKN